VRLLVAALAALVAAPPAGAITVYAAASLTEVFPRIESGPRYSFAGSDQLAVQIREGAPADVFAAASPKAPEQLYRERLVYRPVVFATNRLVLIVPRSNPARIRSVFDLRRRGIKLVVGEPGVPVGDYTRRVLRRLGLTSALRNVVSEETDVKGIVGKVALGEADAGFVYATDVRPVASKVRALELPARAQPKVRYEIAILRSTKRLAAARAFVKRVLAPPGRRALKAAGFGLP
jgi:molybdate transport system substrate-binding protein